jgi:hypothetical protein
MTIKFRNEVLPERTEEYWRYLRDGLCDVESYVAGLLGRELAHAATNDTAEGAKRLQRLDKPVHTLALTVGESFEPLLQIICVLKPCRLLLLLNRRYGSTAGRNHGATLRRLVQTLQDAPGLPAEYRPDVALLEFDLVELTQDTPREVFRQLRDALQKPDALAPHGYDNAVDITGAKKSMVVGAFLYAAHSGLPITYVDFDKYSTEFNKPYGYTCKIGQIADPYELFRLRDWEQVRKLYEHYNFRGARELLEGTPKEPEKSILHAMSSSVDDKTGPAIFELEDVEKVRQVVKLLRVYEAWDIGDFNATQQGLPAISQVPLPTAIERFVGKWFVISGNRFSHVPPNFYEDTADLHIYLFDELKRIKRLIQHNQDFRSAFLRAGGLNEVLMVVRLVRQVTDATDRQALLKALDRHTPPARSLFRALQKPAGTEIHIGDQRGKEIRFEGAPNISLRLQQSMRSWWDTTSLFRESNDWKEFLEIRNKLAHTYVSVPEELAQDAIAFVQANLEDFIGHNLATLPINADAMPWAQLCESYQLDFLPPKLRD